METKYSKRLLFNKTIKRISILMLPVLFAGSICFGQITIYNVSNSMLPENRVTVLTFDSLTNNLWAGTEYGVVRIDNSGSWTVFNSTNSAITDNYIRSITIADDGKVWVGTLGSGIFIYDGTTWTNWNTTNTGICDDGIRDVQFDQYGNLWVATMGGLCMFDGSTWQEWNVFNSGFFTNNIGFVKFKGKEKHIGTVNGGLHILDSLNNLTLYTHYNSGLPDNTLIDAAWETDGSLWLATPAAGLIVHYTGNVWNWYHFYNSDIPTNSVNGIINDNGTKYMTTLDNGLVVYDGINFESYNTGNSAIPEDYLMSVCVDNSNNIWIGTYSSGLVKINKSTIGINDIENNKPILFPTLMQTGHTYKIIDENQITQCNLIDVSGKIISLEKNHNSIQIPISLSAGFYTLICQSKNATNYTQRVVIVR